MPKQNPNAKRRWRLLIYIPMLLMLISLLTVASYTWFSISRTPRVSNMHMFITSVSGLELSQDPLAEEWKLQLDFRDMVDETAPLRPVTWSNRWQRFYAANYGLDGRLTNYEQWFPLQDERHANKDNYEGYYIKTTFFARSGQTVDVSLSPAVEVDEGIDGSGTYLIGTPLWDAQEILHNNGGQGAETAVRIGLRFTPVDKNGEEFGAVPQFFIYEPNCNVHIDGETSGYVPTPSIDNTPNLIDDAHLIRQTSSSWTEAYPVQRNVVVHSLGDFLDEPELFRLQSGDMMKIDLYIWLEGQDIDCTNQISEAQIIANIQFAGKTETQSGLVPIE